MELDWSVIFTYQNLLVKGLLMTIKLSLIGIFFSFLIGSIVGIARSSKIYLIEVPTSYYVEFFRNVPLIVQMFFFYFSFSVVSAIPLLEFIGDMLGIVNQDEFFSALLALTLYTSAYIAEVVRAGINSVPKGQFEGAKSLGMSAYLRMRYIIFPQAFAIIIPPLTSQFLNLIKNSSLAMTLGVAELTFMTQEIDTLTFRGFEAATAVTFLYLFLTLITSILMSFVERHFSKGVKNA